MIATLIQKFSKDGDWVSIRIEDWISENDDFVLFGAGKGLQDFVRRFPKARAKYVVDNDSSKWGNFLEGLEIKSPETLEKCDNDKIRIVVTSSYYKEIKLQLEKMMLKEGTNFINGLARDSNIEMQFIGNRRVEFLCPNNACKNRIKTLYTKEPETIKWINGFDEGSTLWDIGANIGIYSLYAAISRNSKVLAFEPAFSNYYIINKNIEINNLESSVRALCMAFGEETLLGTLNMTSTELGGALHDFGEEKEKTSVAGIDFSVRYKQGMLGFSLDSFIETFKPDFPDFIKIDVDGIEDKIIRGAAKTLRNPRLKSILVELDTNELEYCNEVIDRITGSGMKLIEKSHAEIFNEGRFSSVYNFIFTRV